MEYFNETGEECGIYYIKNIVNNHIYIGSSIMLTKRYKEHKRVLNLNKAPSMILQAAWNKYGENNFQFIVIKTFKNITDHKLRFLEGMLIRLFKAEYNTCLFPENNGKPNYKRKLSKEWIHNLRENNNYKHSNDKKIYNKVCKQNKEGASKIILTINNIEYKFNSIIDACKYLNLKNGCLQGLKQRCHRYNIELKCLNKQTKKVKVTEANGNVLFFDSAGKCDKYYNLWRGCTSNTICHLNGKLFENYAEYI